MPAAPERKVRAAARDGTSRHWRDSSAEHGNAVGNEPFFIERPLAGTGRTAERRMGRLGRIPGPGPVQNMFRPLQGALARQFSIPNGRRTTGEPSTGRASANPGPGTVQNVFCTLLGAQTMLSSAQIGGPPNGRVGPTTTVPPAVGPEQPPHMGRRSPIISSTTALAKCPNHAQFRPEQRGPHWAGGPQHDGATRRPFGAATAHGRGQPHNFLDHSPCRAPNPCQVPLGTVGPTMGGAARRPSGATSAHVRLHPQVFHDHSPCWACSALT